MKSNYIEQVTVFAAAFMSVGEVGLTQLELFKQAGGLGNSPRHPEVVIKQWSKLGHIEKNPGARWRLTDNGKMFFARFCEEHFSQQEQAA